MPVRVGADEPQVLPRLVGLREMALAQLDAGAERVDVGVLETGQQHLPGQVHDLGAGPDQLPYLVVADGGDAAVAHGHRGGPAEDGVDGVHRAAGKDEVGVRVGHGVRSRGRGRGGRASGSGARFRVRASGFGLRAVRQTVVRSIGSVRASASVPRPVAK